MVSPTTRAIADGEITDFSDWSVEELVRGQRKNKRGNWTGKRPKLLPAQLVQELARRQGRHAMALLSAHLVDAAQVIIEIAKKRRQAPQGQTFALTAVTPLPDRHPASPSTSPLTICDTMRRIAPGPERDCLPCYMVMVSHNEEWDEEMG